MTTLYSTNKKRNNDKTPHINKSRLKPILDLTMSVLRYHNAYKMDTAKNKEIPRNNIETNSDMYNFTLSGIVFGFLVSSLLNTSRAFNVFRKPSRSSTLSCLLANTTKSKKVSSDIC